MISLRLLGPVEICDSGGRSIDALLRRPKRVALLSYLATAHPRGFHSRDSVATVFWPDNLQARHALSQAIHVLRSELPLDAVVARGEDVAVNFEVVSCDVIAFEHDISGGRLESALELYRGDFLSGCYLSGTPEFERWLDDERQRLGEAAAGAAWELAFKQVEQGQLLDAERTAQRALALATTDESQVRHLIESLADGGGRAAAVRLYERFRERLAAEFELEPDAETREMISRIRARQTPSSMASPRSAASERVTLVPSALAPPLVGRPRVHDSAFSMIDAGLAGESGCLCVVGATGMGKTRLLDECCGRVQSAGGISFLARPLASDHDARFATLRLLLRSGLADAPGALAIAPQAHDLLASMDPLVADRPSAHSAADTTDIASAIADLVREVATEQPVAVAVDDAHLSDGPTLEVLSLSATLLDASPFLLLLASTPTDAHTPTALTRLRSRVGRDFHGVTVRLDPLELDDTRLIVEHMATWCRSVEELDRLSRRIHFETAGNPFLITTLLRHLESAPTIKEDLLNWPTHGSTYESPLPISVPDLVRVTVVARVGGLCEDTVNVLRAASIGGLSLDPALISSLSGVSEPVLERALDELERIGFVTYNGQRYAFTAPIIKETVRAEYLTHGQRQRLRRRAAAELAQRDDLESRVLRVELLARSDPGADTYAAALSVARDSLQVQADRTARRALVAAERAAGADDVVNVEEIAALRSSLGDRAPP